MNDKELRELDAWIASYIFMFYVHHEGRVPYVSNFKEPDWNTKSGLLPEYTTDPAAVMAVLKKCAEKLDRHKDGNLLTVSVRGGNGKWRVGSMTSYCDAKTLPLAICLFAKRLFTK